MKSLWRKVKQSLQPPVFAEDAQQTQVAFYLWVLAEASLAVALLSGGLLALGDGRDARLLLLLPVVLVLGCILWLARTGRVRLAAVLYITGFWALVMLSSLASGGVQAVGFSMLVIVVVITGLLLGAGGAAWTVAVSLAAGAGLAWAAVAGYLPDRAPLARPLDAFVAQAIVLLSVLGVIYLAQRSVQQSLRQASLEVQVRQQAEAALRQSLARQQALLQAIPDLIFELDRDGNYLDFISASGLTPYAPPEQFLGRNLRDVLPPELAWRLLTAIERTYQSGEAQTLEYSLPSGEHLLDFEARLAVSQNHTVMCIVRDVTRQRQTERQNRQYADIVRNMQVGMYIIQAEDLQDDRSLRVIAANPAALRYSEKDAEQVLGKYVDQAFKTLRSKGFPQSYLQVLRSGAPLELEDVYYDAAGEVSEAYTVKVFALTEDTVGVLFEDVSQRKRAEAGLRRLSDELELRVQERTAQLQAANKELEAFAYSVSHDLRAPLRGIDGYSKLLLDDYAAVLDEEGRGLLGRVRQASQRMAEMIDALLTLSRISRARLDRQAVDLSEMAREILAGLAESEPQRRVDWQVEAGMQAMCDPKLTCIALENLLQNAWKYTARQAQARIRFEPCALDGRLVYCVVDNGAGFDMAYADRLFSPFQRLHRADEFPGFGIGLATVQRIIHQHGGQIWAQAAPGQGASFYFTLG